MLANKTFVRLIVYSLCAVGVAHAQERIKNAVPYVATPIPLADVRVTGGPLKRAQDLDAEYLLKLEPDRMMAYYRKRAGLQPKAEGYPGWDGDGRNLTGHIAGHYLSAVSMMYAAMGDPRFKQRADYLVNEMKEVQDKNGDGFLSALERAREKFAEVAAGNIRSTFFDLNGLWSPWYTLHKTYAGLRDAYRYTGNRTALELEIKFAAWAESILKNLNDEQIQKMLNTEFGGMNEVLVDLYADTGDKRWLNLSHRFDHRAVVEPLARREDRLAGLHGNTQVPKLLGVLMRHVYTGDNADGVAGEFFWDAVVNHHTYATGGHGKDEYFGPPDELSQRIDGPTNESCNVYNMLKMTRVLFALKPDIKYADFLERALFNHVLGSIDPEDGRTCYMVPVGQGVKHEYQEMFKDFTCCVGSGMESHALHGDGIYYASTGRLWVNLFVPSVAKWRSANVQIAMDTNFPEGDSATLKLTVAKPRKFVLAVRRPVWAGDGFTLKVNGNPVKPTSGPGSYVELDRTWKTGDTVSITLPKTLHVEGLADDRNRAALMWGPLVLAGDVGPEQRRSWPTEPVPSLITDNRPIGEWLEPVPQQTGSFRTEGVGRLIGGPQQEIGLVPFYRLHRRTYSIYWDLYTSENWSKKVAGFEAAESKRKILEAATIAFVQPGDDQKEKEFNQRGEETNVDATSGRRARRGKKWFSYDVPVEGEKAQSLLITYFTIERATRSFDILVDGQRIGEQRIERSVPGSAAGRFFDVEYRIPVELLKDKKKITLRFESTGGNEIAGVYGIRLIRADAER